VPPQPSLAPLPAPVLAGALPAGLIPSLRDARQDVPRSYADGCQLDSSTVEPPECVYGDPSGAETVILFGDSHAAQWLPAFEQLAMQRGWRLVSLTKTGCPPVAQTVWNAMLKRAYRECDAWIPLALSRVATEAPALVVVASARDYQVMGDGGRRPLSDRPAAWRDGLATVLAAVDRDSDRVVLLADTPRLGEDPVECLASQDLIERCPSPRSEMVDAGYTDLEAHAASQAGVGFVAATDWLCTPDVCPLVMGDHLLYRDPQHLTASFVVTLADRLALALDAPR
jgi:hypothetical protein